MHRRPGVLLTTLLALGSLCATALPAQAARSDASARRAVSSVIFKGTGYGHGRGMSQYGARNRAERGQGYRTIVNHYYPGTKWGSATGNVSVLITGDTTSDVQVAARSGLTARSLGARKTWRLPARRAGKVVQRWRITPAGHRSTLSYRTHSWHTWRTANGDAQFAAGGRPVRLYVPGGSVQYRGTLRSASANARGTVRDTVNILPLDSYLKGVVPREMPGSWRAAAVRAQAVAARTYAAFKRARPRSAHYQICDTAQCQVYGGYSAEYSRSNDAVAATARQVLTYGGTPAFTEFSASNGGYSVAGDFPYLTAAPDPDDHGYPGDPWQRTFTARQIARNWTDLGDLVSIKVTKRDGDEAHPGHVTEVLVEGTDNDHTVDGATLARWLGLRSSMFTITSA